MLRNIQVFLNDIWYDLKKKPTKEGSQLYEEIVQLKFEAVVSL